MKFVKPLSPVFAISILIFTLIPLRLHCEQSLEPAEVLRMCIGTMKGVDDYIVVVHQVQRVGGKLLPEEVILYKFKRPNSVYLRSIGEVSKGQEIIYQEGWNDGKMMGHMGGALDGIILNLKPGSDMASKRTRHTIDKSSLIYMMNTLERSMNYAQTHPEDNMIVEDIGTKIVFGKPVRLIRIKLPHGKDYPYYAPVSIFGIDEERHLPLYYRSYGPAGEMWEDYRYRDLKTNVGLTDLDFDPKNPEYNFQ
jgi:hypothetical protein